MQVAVSLPDNCDGDLHRVALTSPGGTLGQVVVVMVVVVVGGR